jgi:hypothetical protein
LAKNGDYVRSSDVMVWGIAAIVAWALAVLAGNLSGMVPANLYASLHASRAEGGTLNQLRMQVVALETGLAEWRREVGSLSRRLDLGEDSAADALEGTVPALIEAQNREALVDETATGSIPAPSGEPETGLPEVSVRLQPLTPELLRPPALPMPEPLETEFRQGIGIGFPVDPGRAALAWQAIRAESGSLLDGLAPLAAPAEAGTQLRLLAGPLPDAAAAADLCERLDRLGFACAPLPYAGAALPPVALD